MRRTRDGGCDRSEAFTSVTSELRAFADLVVGCRERLGVRARWRVWRGDVMLRVGLVWSMRSYDVWVWKVGCVGVEGVRVGGR